MAKYNPSEIDIVLVELVAMPPVRQLELQVKKLLLTNDHMLAEHFKLRQEAVVRLMPFLRVVSDVKVNPHEMNRPRLVVLLYLGCVIFARDTTS